MCQPSCQTMRDTQKETLQVPFKTVLLSSGDEQHALKITEVSSLGIISSAEWGRGQSRALGRELAGGDR